MVGSSVASAVEQAPSSKSGPDNNPSNTKPTQTRALNAHGETLMNSQDQPNMSSESPSKKVEFAIDESASAVSNNVSSIANEMHLTPELIVRVATYAEAVNSSELWNICLAVGRAPSRIIRHHYLKNNSSFLVRCIRAFCSEQIKNKKVRDYYLAWMAVNTDWRSFVTKDNMDDCKVVCKREGDNFTNSFHPYAAFNNPAVAIQFGLMEPLRYLVEEKRVHINDIVWTPLNCPEKMHLLYLSMNFAQDFNSDCSIFRYLLMNSDRSLRGMQARLLRLRHASLCPSQEDQCTLLDSCGSMKRLWRHIIHCKESETCTVQDCVSSRNVLTHFYHCKEKGCAMCRPLREVVAKSISTADIEVLAAHSSEALRRLMGAPSQNITCKIALAENSVALFVSLFQFPSRCEETGRQMFPFLNIFMEHPDFDINGKFVS